VREQEVDQPVTSSTQLVSNKKTQVENRNGQTEAMGTESLR